MKWCSHKPREDRISGKKKQVANDKNLSPEFRNIC